MIRRAWWLAGLLACEPPTARTDVDVHRDACLARHADAPARYSGLVRAFCSEHAHLGGIGASLAVAEAGVLTFTATTGLRCSDRTDLVEPTTAFRIGSLTKLLTAALTLTLVDDLDAPILATIHLRHLLQHTSGLPDLDPRAAPPDWFAHLVTRPRWAAPGTLWSYSNAGYAIVGRTLEHLADQPYATLLADRILTPLQLAHTTADLDRALQTNTACGHLGRGPATKPLTVREDLELGASGAAWTIPAGGVVASAPDLVALVLGLQHPTHSPLSPSARTTLLTADIPTHERPGERYALGLRMQSLADGTPLYAHSGHTGDFAADLSFAPDRGFVLVVLSNTGDPLRATLAAAHHDLLGHDPPPSAPPAPPTAYNGRYSVPGDPTPITVDNFTLTAPQLGLAAVPLVSRGDHRFTAADHTLTFVFTAGPGHATHLRTRSLVATHAR